MVGISASVSPQRKYMQPIFIATPVSNHFRSCSASGWVRSADGKKIQKKLWDETIEQLEGETGTNLQSYL